MKQNITPEQLNELSDKGLKAYKKYLEGKYINVLGYIHDKKGKPIDVSNYKVEELPVLSIGQLIEFLDDKTDDITYVDDYFNHQIGYNHTYGSIDEDKDGPAYAIAWNGKELVDALWKACKEVLNGNNKINT